MVGKIIETVESHGKTYKRLNGTYYNFNTPDKTIAILDREYHRQTRLKIEYGDIETGKSWGDIETGKIGRSTGPVHMPLCIYNSRSMGGGALLTHCIVRISTSKGDQRIFQHESYQPAN